LDLGPMALWSAGVTKGQQEVGHVSGEASPFLWGNVWLPLQGRDGNRRSFARVDPAGRSELARIGDAIGLAPTIGYQQRHVLFHWSGIDQSPVARERMHPLCH